MDISKRRKDLSLLLVAPTNASLAVYLCVSFPPPPPLRFATVNISVLRVNGDNGNEFDGESDGEEIGASFRQLPHRCAGETGASSAAETNWARARVLVST